VRRSTRILVILFIVLTAIGGAAAAHENRQNEQIEAAEQTIEAPSRNMTPGACRR
jgi:cell division protein FtsL